VIAQIDLAPATVEAPAAEDGGVERNMFAWTKILHRAAHSLNNSSRFMSHDDRRQTASRASIVSMHVTSADATGLNTNEQVIVTELRLWHVDEVKLFVLRENERLHEFSLCYGRQSKNKGTTLTGGHKSSRMRFSIASAKNMIYQLGAPQRGMRYSSTEIPNASAYHERS
jgi:hypothetical protein